MMVGVSGGGSTGRFCRLVYARHWLWQFSDSASRTQTDRQQLLGSTRAAPNNAERGSAVTRQHARTHAGCKQDAHTVGSGQAHSRAKMGQVPSNCGEGLSRKPADHGHTPKWGLARPEGQAVS